MSAIGRGLTAVTQHARLDALVVVAGPPVPEVAELEKKGNVRISGLDAKPESLSAWHSQR